MKIVTISLILWLLLVGAILFNTFNGIDEIDLKLSLAANTAIADKRLIKSLQNRIELHEKDMARCYSKRGITVNGAVCDEVRAFLVGEYSLFPF